jgi:hypothetical protein
MRKVIGYVTLAAWIGTACNAATLTREKALAVLQSVQTGLVPNNMALVVVKSPAPLLLVNPDPDVLSGQKLFHVPSVKYYLEMVRGSGVTQVHIDYALNSAREMRYHRELVAAGLITFAGGKKTTDSSLPPVGFPGINCYFNPTPALSWTVENPYWVTLVRILPNTAHVTAVTGISGEGDQRTVETIVTVTATPTFAKIRQAAAKVIQEDLGDPETYARTCNPSNLLCGILQRPDEGTYPKTFHLQHYDDGWRVVGSD